MGSFVRRTLPLILVLLSVTRRRARYLVPYTRVYLDANQKQLVYLDPKMQMVNTALVILSVKNNANSTNFFAQMGLILKVVKTPTCVYQEEETTTEIYVPQNVLQPAPITNSSALEPFKELVAGESHFALKRKWM